MLAAETVLIEGPDAAAFAQAQFSANLDALQPGHWQFSAWLDAQGRVRALFHLTRLADDRLLLLLRGGQAAPLADALRRFVLRAKLSLTAQPTSPLGSGPALPLYRIEGDTATLRLGCGDHSLCIGIAGDDAWRLAQLRMGWPWLPDALLDTFLPPGLALETLGATAFDKGCYPGQEIVARLHYRGGHRWHLRHVGLAQGVASGTPIQAAENVVGHLLDVVSAADEAEALAVIAEQAANELKTPEGVAVRLLDQERKTEKVILVKS